MCVSFNEDQMPQDPFADDPNDPASLLEPEDTPDPLSPQDIMALHEDLRSVREFRRLLEPQGVRGIGMMCDDCEELHFYDWGIMETNIRTMLSDSNVPVHEPSVNPNPDDYVSWDYCAGYADAMNFGAFSRHK